MSCATTADPDREGPARGRFLRVPRCCRADGPRPVPAARARAGLPDRHRAADRRHVPACAAVDGRGPAGDRRRGAGDPDGDARRSGRRPARRRSGLGRVRTPAAAARRADRSRPGLGAVRGGAGGRVPDRGAGRAGLRGRGHVRRRAGDRARPVHRPGSGATAVAADARDRCRADPGADPRRPAAGGHVVAGDLRGPGGHRPGPDRGGIARPARDPAPGAPPVGPARGDAAHLPVDPWRPSLRLPRPRRRPDVRCDVRLHLGLPLRAAGPVRARRADVCTGLRRERDRDRGDDPAQPGAAALVVSAAGALDSRADRHGRLAGPGRHDAHRRGWAGRPPGPAVRGDLGVRSDVPERAGPGAVAARRGRRHGVGADRCRPVRPRWSRRPAGRPARHIERGADGRRDAGRDLRRGDADALRRDACSPGGRGLSRPVVGR